jgi:hypothetical protein
VPTALETETDQLFRWSVDVPALFFACPPAALSQVLPCAPDGPDQTTVELEHRLLERLVDGQALRDGINSGGGWTAMLELFAKAAANQE